LFIHDATQTIQRNVSALLYFLQTVVRGLQICSGSGTN
jgi:hypothetical protein